jgi:hypothetical protein
MYTVPQTSLTTAAGVGRRLSEGLGSTERRSELFAIGRSLLQLCHRSETTRREPRRFSKLTFLRLRWVSRHVDTEAKFVENAALKIDLVARFGAVDERSGR